jgi:hypothetical protein
LVVGKKIRVRRSIGRPAPGGKASLEGTKRVHAVPGTTDRHDRLSLRY